MTDSGSSRRSILDVLEAASQSESEFLTFDYTDLREHIRSLIAVARVAESNRADLPWTSDERLSAALSPLLRDFS